MILVPAEVEAEEEQVETLSDLSDMDMTEFIVEDEDEIRQKEQMWDTLNQEYLEQQELKRLQVEEAHKVLPCKACALLALHTSSAADRPEVH